MKPQFIDVHAHINFSAYDGDRDETIKRALDNGTWMINVGTQKDTSKSAVELAEKYEKGVYAIIGLHPIHTSASHHDKEELGEGGKSFTSRGEIFDTEFYRNLAKSKKVVGIGECGLDFFRVMDAGAREKQTSAFRAQIELALELDLPLMIHCRDAYPEVLAILKEYKKTAGDILRGDFHFFVGTTEIAQEIIDIGFHISFTGVITFPPRVDKASSRVEAGAREYSKLIKYIPIQQIMSETDCPYVTPMPHRGKRNEPLYVEQVVRKIADIRGADFEEIRSQLVQNTLTFFDLTNR